MRTLPGNDLLLGNISNGNANLVLSKESRATHTYICGATGTGKSKMLEHLIRQDIKAWRKSKCGLLVLDPHGKLDDDLMRWLAWNQDVLHRPIIPIDLRRTDWVVAYNMLRNRPASDPAVIVKQFVEAMAYVWGESGTTATPLFARWASNIIGTLYEKKLTLVEAVHLINQRGKSARRALTANLSDRLTAQDWDSAQLYTPKEFEDRVGSTINRLRPFLSTQILRLMFGQDRVSLNLNAALEEGHIILVSLARGKNRVSQEDASLFATLLLSDLWAAASERGKKNVKPFYCYIDEFQNFLTPAIAKNLDEARGFGLHLTLAHQFPNQLLHAGAHGEQIWDSIMVNARTKIVFGMSGEKNLRPLAEDLFMGVMDPNKIKLELYSTKVMGYAEEIRTTYSKSSASGSGSGHQSGGASGHGSGGTELPNNPQGKSKSTSEFQSTSDSHSQSYSESHGESESDAPMLIPIMGKELSSVQFESLEEQLFRAMAVLHDQSQRQCVVKIAGQRVPVSLSTPTVHDMPSSDKYVEEYVQKLLKGLPFALPTGEAKKQLAEREAKFTESAVLAMVDEPATSKRRIK